MYLLYTFIYAGALVVSLPYWLIGMLRAGKYRAGLMERFGQVPQRLRLPAQNERSIWFHAVSVGEVLAISGLITSLKQREPDARIFVSTTTLAGQTLARQRFGEANVFYLPLDLPFTLNPILRAIHPQLFVLAETEFWPNLLRLVKGSGTRVAVVNARISDRSLPGYRRFRRLLSLVLKNVDLFLAQTETDVERLVSIGAAPDRVKLGGNLKFDVKASPDSELTSLLSPVLARDQQVLVFGSTVEGEEPLLLTAFKRILNEFPQTLIILAPRHPERFDGVAEWLRTSGLSFWRRSAWAGKPIAGGILLLDTIGELASVYSLAEIAFVGGSLVPRGGHNILEPAHFGKPIIIGPHYENFRDVVREFLTAEAVRVVSPDQFAGTLLYLLRTPVETADLGGRAFAVVARGAGSTQHALDALVELLERDRKPEALSLPPS